MRANDQAVCWRFWIALMVFISMSMVSCGSDDGLILFEKSIYTKTPEEIGIDVEIRYKKNPTETWQFLQFVSCENLDTGEPFLSSTGEGPIMHGFSLDPSFNQNDSTSIYFPDCIDKSDFIQLTDFVTRKRTDLSKNPFLWKALTVPVCLTCKPYPVAGPIIQYQFLNLDESSFYHEVLHGIRRSHAQRIIKEVLHAYWESEELSNKKRTELGYLENMVFE